MSSNLHFGDWVTVADSTFPFGEIQCEADPVDGEAAYWVVLADADGGMTSTPVTVRASKLTLVAFEDGDRVGYVGNPGLTGTVTADQGRQVYEVRWDGSGETATWMAVSARQLRLAPAPVDETPAAGAAVKDLTVGQRVTFLDDPNDIGTVRRVWTSPLVSSRYSVHWDSEIYNESRLYPRTELVPVPAAGFWIITYGEYDWRRVCGVASSKAKAEEIISAKLAAAEPYRLDPEDFHTWGPYTLDEIMTDASGEPDWAFQKS